MFILAMNLPNALPEIQKNNKGLFYYLFVTSWPSAQLFTVEKHYRDAKTTFCQFANIEWETKMCIKNNIVIE